MPDLGPVRCIIALVSVGDTSGLRLLCPSRCTEVQIYLEYTSGWANIGYFRCIAKNRINKIHRNSTIYTNPDVSISNIHRKPRFSSNPDAFQLISRDSTRFLSQHTPAQAGKNKQNTSEFNYLWQSRCIAQNCQNKLHRNSTIHSHPDVSKPSIHRKLAKVPSRIRV